MTTKGFVYAAFGAIILVIAAYFCGMYVAEAFNGLLKLLGV